MKLNTSGYRGKVQKGVIVYTDDPDQPTFRLILYGKIKPIIDVLPGRFIYFSGKSNNIPAKTIEFIGVNSQFHILRIRSNLDSKIRYELKTIKDGKHYQLKISNLADEGSYSGWLICETDSPKKPEIRIRIQAYIEGKISVHPPTVWIGKAGPNFPLRKGLIHVVSNEGKPFRITKLDYDKSLLIVKQSPDPTSYGFILEITPNLSNLPKGSHKKTFLTLQTDIKPNHSYKVAIYLINQ